MPGRSRLVLALLAAALPARAGLFGSSYEKYVSPEGDFSADKPAGWVVERFVGDPTNTSTYWLPVYSGHGTQHIDTIFHDPADEGYSVVVRWFEYHTALRLRDGLIEYATNLGDFVNNLRVTYYIGGDYNGGRAIKWSDSAGGHPIQFAYQKDWPEYDHSRSDPPCNVRTMFGQGEGYIKRTCEGVHYYTLIDGPNGVYALIYPSPTGADPAMMKHYHRLLKSFRKLAEGPADALAKRKAAEALAAKAAAKPEAPKPAPAAPAPAAPKPAVVASDVDVPSYSAKPRPDDFAVVVGVEDYDRLPKAANAARDADAVRRHLLALGWPERNVILLENRDAVRSRLAAYLEEWLPRNVTARSTVFFYYSGHGAPDLKTGAAYLVPSDGDATFLQSTAFPVKQLYSDLQKLPAKSVIVALDACFSGSGGRSVIAAGARPLVAKPADLSPEGKLSVLAAASGEEITSSLDSQGHGLFTYYLLKGLSDGKRSTSALLDYAKPRVQDEARRQNREQTPVLLGADAPL